MAKYYKGRNSDIPKDASDYVNDTASGKRKSEIPANLSPEEYRDMAEMYKATAGIHVNDINKELKYTNLAKECERLAGRKVKDTGLARECKKADKTRIASELMKIAESIKMYLFPILIIGFLISIIFFSFNLTGNAIGNLSLTTSNVIGGIFFVASISITLLYFKNKNRK